MVMGMRISQKLEYACRALAQLAKRHDTRLLTRLEDLAQREAVSANFLVQILNDLRRGGLVESKRGKVGGYSLAKPPAMITLRDIVEAIDPEMLNSSVTNIGESGLGVSLVWQQISSQNVAVLSAITLERMAGSTGDTMFYI